MRVNAQESPIFRLFLRVFAFAAIGAVSACRAQPATGAKDVAFAAASGSTIRATLYTTADADRPPAILLLHMFGSDRRSWDRFAREAASHGYAALAIDLPALGGAAASSGGLREPTSSEATNRDLGAAIQYLLDTGADPDNLIIAGASLGANIAINYAVADPRVQAVIALSPGEDYRGVRVLPATAELTRRPLLIMATEGDSYSAATARKMHAASENQCELRIYPGSAHGTDILDAISNSSGQIFLWLDPIVER